MAKTANDQWEDVSNSSDWEDVTSTPKRQFNTIAEAQAAMQQARQGQLAAERNNTDLSVLERGLSATNKDLAAIPFDFVNQFLVNTPRSVMNKMVVPIPEAQSPVAKFAQKAGGVAGAIASPVNKIAAGSNLLLRGAIQGGLYAPTNDPLDIKQRLGQAVVGGLVAPIAGGIAKNVANIENNLNKFAGTQMNKLIKFRKNDYAFGKSPDTALASEKIYGKSLEDMGEKVNQRINDLSTEATNIANTPRYSKIKLNFSTVLSPIDDAIKEAAARGDEATLNRLNSKKNAITDLLEPDAKGGIVSKGKRKLDELNLKESIELKRRVGDLRDWVKDATDKQNELVDSALGKVYYNINKNIDSVAPDLSKVNKRWSNLIAAKGAIERRIPMDSRKGLSMMDALSGLAGGVAGAAQGGPLPAILLGGVGAGLHNLGTSPLARSGAASLLYRNNAKAVNPAVIEFLNRAAITGGGRTLDSVNQILNQ